MKLEREEDREPYVGTTQRRGVVTKKRLSHFKFVNPYLSIHICQSIFDNPILSMLDTVKFILFNSSHFDFIKV